MVKFGKAFLSQLTTDGINGPFVTIMLNTHVGHQNVEKDQIKFENFAKKQNADLRRDIPTTHGTNSRKKLRLCLLIRHFGAAAPKVWQ